MDNKKLERVIKGLECCAHEEIGDCNNCPYNENTPHCDIAMMRDAIALLKALCAFKSYFDDLYGAGLDVANYHLNGVTEPFDSFYDSAMEEMQNAR